MPSGSSNRIWIVVILTLLFVLLGARSASGVVTKPERPPTMAPALPTTQEDARARLTDGFHQILDFFERRNFSLLAAWREMRASGDPQFFERKYPAISRELDTWAAKLSSVDVSEATVGRLDFTFMLEDLAPVALDPEASRIQRDNALLTVCMVCLLDDLRCDVEAYHRFLAAVVADDPSPSRKAEALRWWRATDGFIDEGMLESVLASPAGTDLDVRSEIAQTLLAIDTRRSLHAQRLLATTRGVGEDPRGVSSGIACAVIRRFALEEFDEAAPDLIGALQDPSRDVRTCAADSLERLSGRDFGFDPSNDAPANLEAIERWRAWWKESGADAGGSAR